VVAVTGSSMGKMGLGEAGRRVYAVSAGGGSGFSRGEGRRGWRSKCGIAVSWSSGALLECARCNVQA
jgi:hypothetical protein